MNSQSENDIALTLDVDWAPDFMIDFAAEILIEHRVRATWFVTHDSPALTRLRQHSDLFELGIHPNFFPESSQGNTAEAVLRHCLELVPDAVSVRTHGLLQSTPLLAQIMDQTPVKSDCSLFVPHAVNLRPVEYQWAQRTLLRVPYFWEDDFEMERTTPCWQLRQLLAKGPGLKVFDFHPVHVYLNSRTMAAYRSLKERAPNLSESTPELAAAAIQSGAGSQTLFIELAKHLGETGRSLLMRDIYKQWQESMNPGELSRADANEV
jgi:hypothetical protein